TCCAGIQSNFTARSTLLEAMTMDKPVKINAAAKILNAKPTRLRQKMRARGIVDKNNLPRHDLVERGLFEVKTGQFVKGRTGIRQNYAVTLVTGSGLTFLSALMEEGKADQAAERSM
ncbi:MAG TPA: hypothetical protein DEG76_02595, partial [Pseudohongiella sp.]|nr:hypothetical protein [Pseudohongiella sp.]